MSQSDLEGSCVLSDLEGSCLLSDLKGSCVLSDLLEGRSFAEADHSCFELEGSLLQAD